MKNLLHLVAVLMSKFAQVKLSKELETKDGLKFHIDMDELQNDCVAMLKDEAGEQTPIENGEYELADGTKFSALDGVVTMAETPAGADPKMDLSAVKDQVLELQAAEAAEAQAALIAKQVKEEAAKLAKAKKPVTGPLGAGQSAANADDTPMEAFLSGLGGTTSQRAKKQLQNARNFHGVDVNLATDDPVNSQTWVAESASEWITAAVMSCKTLDQAAVNIFPNLTEATAIEVLGGSGLLAAETCDFTHGGDTTLGEVILDLTKVQINHEMCKDKFEATWRAKQMSSSANNNMPQSYVQDFATMMVGLAGQGVQQNIWNGNSGIAGAPTLINGYYKDLVDNGGVSVGTWTPGTSDLPANIVAELRKLLSNQSEAVLDNENLVIYMNGKHLLAYRQAVADAGDVAANAANSGIAAQLDGVTIIETPGCPVPICAVKDNMLFGTCLVSDKNDIRVIDRSETEGDLNTRFVLRFGMAAKVGIPGEATYFTHA